MASVPVAYTATMERAIAQLEKDLKALFPESLWNDLHLQINSVGREHCGARTHGECCGGVRLTRHCRLAGRRDVRLTKRGVEPHAAAGVCGLGVGISRPGSRPLPLMISPK